MKMEYVIEQVDYLGGLCSRAKERLSEADLAAAARLHFGCSVAKSYWLASLAHEAAYLGDIAR